MTELQNAIMPMPSAADLGDTFPEPGPDAPFKVGVSGKYKLLIRSVSPNFKGFDYELADSDGNVYKATSNLKYPENGILRCIVTIKVERSHLVVEGTSICRKQDLSSPLPVEKNPTTKAKPRLKSESAIEKGKLEDPFLNRLPGAYKLRIIGVESKNKVYTYVLEDVQGREYEAKSVHIFPVGTIVSCFVIPCKPKDGIKAEVTSIGYKKKALKKSSKHGKRSDFSQRDWPPSPSVGDHFHLVYTPMGNKR